MPRGFGMTIRNLRNATTPKLDPATFPHNEKRAAVHKDRRSSFYVAGFPATPLYLLSSPALTQAQQSTKSLRALEYDAWRILPAWENVMTPPAVAVVEK